MQKKTEELVNHWRDVGPIEWAEGPFGWIGIDGNPITLEAWQKAVLGAWWAHRDSISTLLISNIKKTGKTFLNGIVLAWRWLALPGEHFAVGNDLDQSAGRQFKQIADMVIRNEYLKRNTRVSSKQLVFEPTGSTVQALSVDAAGNAGANHLTASHTEAWGIIYEGGRRAYEELTVPPGTFYGFPAMRIADSYAGFDGESETWHDLVDRGLKGKKISDEWGIYSNGGLLLFHINGEEAQRRCFRGSPEDAEIYYSEQRMNLRNGTYLRLHENRRAAGSEQFISLEEWDKCIDQDFRPLLPDLSKNLFLAVDASTKHDSSAVVAVYYDRDMGKVCLARHRIWHPSTHQPLDLDATIGDYLRGMRDSYHVVEVRYDPYQMHDLSTRLRSDGLRMVEFPQSVPNLTRMGQNLFELIKNRNILLYPDAEMRRSAGHCVAMQSSRGWRIAKEKTSHKIDVVVALAMAAIGAVENAHYIEPSKLISFW